MHDRKFSPGVFTQSGSIAAPQSWGTRSTSTACTSASGTHFVQLRVSQQGAVISDSEFSTIQAINDAARETSTPTP